MTVKRLVDEKKGEYWKEYVDGYFFSNFGRAKHVYKNGSEYLLSPYIHKTSGKTVLKIHGQAHTVSKIVYELFVGPVPSGYNIIHKNKVRSDNSLVNLQLATPRETGLHYGNRNRKAIIYDATNDCYYKSTREAAKKLFISRQTVSDYCSGKRKNPMFDLSWERCCD